MAIATSSALDLFTVSRGHYRVAFSSRAGGVSVGPYAGLNLSSSVGDDEEAVYHNRRLLLEAAGAPRMGALAILEHGPIVRRALAEDLLDPEADHASCDGLFSEAAGISLMLLVADCLPVALLRRDRPGLAIIHCGWRGLKTGVVAYGVNALGGDIEAVVGPGIGPCCYEVSDELAAQFAERFGPCGQGRMLDLRAALVQALKAAGVAAVEHVDHCTSCDDRFFSYRRDGGQTGRQAILAWSE